MEIKRLAEEKYSDIEVLLNEMLTIVPHLNDLCFITHNGKKFLLSFTEDKIGIIDITPNKDGFLNRYSISLDGNEYETEESKYEIVKNDEINLISVKRDDFLTENIKMLAYYGNRDFSGLDFLTYISYVEAVDKATTIIYDVTNRPGNLNSKVLYMGYHVPTSIKISYMSDGILSREINRVFGYSEEEDNYNEPYFMFLGHPVGSKKIYTPAELADYLKENEFDLSIPNDIKNILTDTHEEYKTLKLVSNEYKKYISKGI